MTIPLSALREAVAGLEGRRKGGGAGLFRLGWPPLDEALGGGLAQGTLHEVYAASARDAAAAAGFALGLGLLAAGGRPILWARQEMIDAEAGVLHGDGVAAFGLKPERLLVVRARDPAEALRAAAEAARCAAVGAALIEVWGTPKVLDLSASRRLALAANATGVTVLVIRLAAAPEPSAAASRWSVAAAASTPLEANAPGRPAFAVALLRHRGGLPSRNWHLEWDRDRTTFEPAPHPRSVVPVSGDRPAGGEGEAFRRRRAG